jgi:hypothetical protein
MDKIDIGDEKQIFLQANKWEKCVLNAKQMGSFNESKMFLELLGGSFKNHVNCGHYV